MMIRSVDNWKLQKGLIFYDENFGVAGITGASQSYSRLYVTRDGGRTFEEMKLPMDLVSELPQIAIDCGFTVEDFDYLNMPEKRGRHIDDNGYHRCSGERWDCISVN